MPGRSMPRKAPGRRPPRLRLPATSRSSQRRNRSGRGPFGSGDGFQRRHHHFQPLLDDRVSQRGLAGKVAVDARVRHAQRRGRHRRPSPSRARTGATRPTRPRESARTSVTASPMAFFASSYRRYLIDRSSVHRLHRLRRVPVARGRASRQDRVDLLQLRRVSAARRRRRGSRRGT